MGKEGEDLTRHDKWLCMMYPQLMPLQKLLADNSVIFISMRRLAGCLDIAKPQQRVRGLMIFT